MTKLPFAFIRLRMHNLFQFELMHVVHGTGYIYVHFHGRNIKVCDRCYIVIATLEILVHAVHILFINAGTITAQLFLVHPHPLRCILGRSPGKMVTKMVINHVKQHVLSLE